MPNNYENEEPRFQPSPETEEIVQKWMIEAFGRRPLDHAERDLVLGGMARDGRMFIYNDLAKHYAASLPRDGGGSEQPIPAEAKLCALHHLHVEHLVQLKSNLFVRDRKQAPLRKQIQRMLPCQPSMALAHPRDPAEHGKLGPCGYARACPFCYSRSVRHLFTRVRDGVLPSLGSDTCLITLAVETSDDAMTAHFGFQSPLASKLAYFNSRLRPAIRGLATELGARGGVVTLEVGPQRGDVDTWIGNELERQTINGFGYSMGFLSQVVATSDLLARLIYDDSPRELVGRLREATGISELQLSCFVHDPGEVGLRHAVFGRSPSYENDGDRGGFRGVFEYQPWWICNDDQWLDHWAATKRMHLYDLWGTWLGQCPRPELKSKGFVFINEPARRGLRRRRQALEQVNRRRKEEVDQRRSRLLLRISDRLTIDTLPMLTWRKLQAWLGTWHGKVSQRDATWLLKQLPLPEYPGAFDAPEDSELVSVYL